MHDCDLSLFPIVYVFVAGPVDADCAQSITASLEDALRRAAREGVQLFQLVNGLHVTSVGPLARKAIAEWDQALDPQLHDRRSARVVLTQSMALRGAITAISWFSPRMKDTRSVESIDDAVKVIHDAMTDAGVPMSPDQIASLRILHADAETAFATM